MHDELFSSWLTRAALAQGCDPLVLTGALWPHWRVWARDPDRGLNKEQLLTLTRISGIEGLMFEASSLRPTASAITQVSLDQLAIWPWMLALGSRNQKRHGGLQYCPCCLQEDIKPYYRLQWRLAWHTACPVHGVSLLDRCSNCHAALEPHRLPAEAPHLATCATCKRDLRNAHTTALLPQALAFQQSADELISSGLGTYGTEKLAISEWFELSRYFVLLLRKIALRRSERLDKFAKILGVNTENLCMPATGLALELLPITERSRLLAGAWEIHQAGPGRFLAATKETALTKAFLCEQRQRNPNTIVKLIETLPEKNTTKRRRTLGDKLKPRSRHAVMRMFARLQRKVLVTGR